MRDFRDAKTMAHALREALARNGVETTHSESLELIAKAFGYDNWNVLSAKIEAAHPRAVDTEAASAAGPEPAPPKILYCSFCRKSQHEVKKLIAGPAVYICDECVELCTDIVRDGVLWKVLSCLRAGGENAGEGYQAALGHVRSKSTEEVASYVEQIKSGVSHSRETLQLIDRRLAIPDGEVPPESDASASRFFAKSKEELVAVKINAQRELAHYENALRIGTSVLEERGQAGS